MLSLSGAVRFSDAWCICSVLRCGVAWLGVRFKSAGLDCVVLGCDITGDSRVGGIRRVALVQGGIRRDGSTFTVLSRTCRLAAPKRGVVQSKGGDNLTARFQIPNGLLHILSER